MRRLLAFLCLILLPAFACAHAIGVDCTVRGAKVEVEAYYDDDSPAAKAKVEVVTAKDAIIDRGITDDKGKWSFATPAPGNYEVRVDGGAGHRAKRSLIIPGAMAPPPINDGVNRAEFTNTPWLKIAIGLGVIGSCTGVFLLVSFLRKSPSTTISPAPSSREA